MMWILFLGTLIISALAAAMVQANYARLSRAKRVLRGMGIIGSGAEAEGVSSVLNAAAWTYVAAFLTSLVYFLWYLAPLLGGTRRD